MAELADAHGSGPCGKPWGFESLRPHQLNESGYQKVSVFVCLELSSEGFEPNARCAYSSGHFVSFAVLFTDQASLGKKGEGRDCEGRQFGELPSKERSESSERKTKDGRPAAAGL